MKASSILGWRYLVSKIHPQLPLSPRDSEKLLSLLKVSFRQQFDREHPEALSGSRHATDNHLRSIFKSPLFEAEPKTRRSPSLEQRHGSQLGRIQDLLERPMEYFKEQVTAGTANLENAKVCLTAQHKRLSRSSGVASKILVKSSDTGSIVLSWLWSSGLAESRSFLEDRSFIGLLAPFLVIEGRGDLIWRWLLEIQPPIDDALQGNPFKIRRYTFFKLIQSETKFGAGVMSSLKIFLDRSNEIRSSPQALKYIPEGLFDRAGTYLCMELAQASEINTVAVDIYDRFHQSITSWSSIPLYHRGLMELHHPRSPTTTSALEYLKGWTPKTQAWRAAARLGLKAAEILLQKDAHADALWVVNFLKTNFAEKLGITPAAQDSDQSLFKEEKDARRQEEISLRSLEALETH